MTVTERKAHTTERCSWCNYPLPAHSDICVAYHERLAKACAKRLLEDRNLEQPSEREAAYRQGYRDGHEDGAEFGDESYHKDAETEGWVNYQRGDHMKEH